VGRTISCDYGLGKSGEEAGGDFFGFDRRTKGGHQHGELVTTDAGHGVPGSRRALQALRDSPQHVVADSLPKGVVDGLELGPGRPGQ
jgi:hypothetical protein